MCGHWGWPNLTYAEISGLVKCKSSYSGSVMDWSTHWLGTVVKVARCVVWFRDYQMCYSLSSGRMLNNTRVLYICEKMYVYPYNNASNCTALYQVGTNCEQFTDSKNFKNSDKLPKLYNIYIELACTQWCNAVAYPFGANCQANVLSVSAWMDIDFLITFDDCSNKTSAVCCNVPSSHLLISHFSFPRSFLLFEWPLSTLSLDGNASAHSSVMPHFRLL